MLKVLITPPVAEFLGVHEQHWHVAVKQDVKGSVRQLGYLVAFSVRPTQRQVRQAKKMAKAAFQDYLNQGGEA